MKSILLTLFVVMLSSEIFPQWTQTNGPEGVSVSSLFSMNGTIYAGTQTNGIYSSTDDGLTWVPKNSGIESFEIAAMASTPGHLFAGTFGHGVYRSTDDGQTWLPPTSGTNLASTGMVVKDTNIFVSSVNDGVYRSTDNGATWIKKLFGWDYITAMGVSGNKIFASTDSYYTLVSTDNGDTWTYLNSIPGFNRWCYYTEGDLILIGGDNEIYRSTDQGITFTTLPLNINYGLVNVYSVYKTGSTIFAGTSYDGVYKSTDNGSTWAPANNGMGPKDIRALTPGSSLTIMAGSHYSGIYRSSDSGSSWNKSLEGIPPGSSVLSMFNSRYGLIVGTRDGMYETTDNGSNWSKLTGASDTVNYGEIRGLCEKDGIIYAATFLQFNSTVYKSSDNGTTWIRSGNGLPPDLTFIFNLVSSGNNIVAATDEGLYYSSDDGNSWFLSNLPVTDIQDISATENYIYAIVFSYGIYQSANNGVSWYPVLLLGADFVSISAKDNYAYSGTFFDGAVYTPNNGSSWYDCTGFPSGEAVFAFGPVSDGLVLAATSVDPNWIYASTDYGVYFYPYSEGLGPNAITEHFAVNDTFMFAGTDYNGVWRRLRPGITPVELSSFTATANKTDITLNWQTATEKNNSGFEIQRSDVRDQKSETLDWKKIGFIKGQGTSTNKNHYSFVDKNPGTGSYSYKLIQIDFDGTRTESKIVNIEINSLPTEYALMQNYPNPFNPSTTIQYSIPESGNVKVIVYNSLGEEVKVLKNDFEEAGTYRINFNAGELSTGIYYYNITAGNFNSARKMVLLK